MQRRPSGPVQQLHAGSEPRGQAAEDGGVGNQEAQVVVTATLAVVLIVVAVAAGGAAQGTLGLDSPGKGGRGGGGRISRRRGARQRGAAGGARRLAGRRRGRGRRRAGGWRGHGDSHGPGLLAASRDPDAQAARRWRERGQRGGPGRAGGGAQARSVALSALPLPLRALAGGKQTSAGRREFVEDGLEDAQPDGSRGRIYMFGRGSLGPCWTELVPGLSAAGAHAACTDWVFLDAPDR